MKWWNNTRLNSMFDVLVYGLENCHKPGEVTETVPGQSEARHKPPFENTEQ